MSVKKTRRRFIKRLLALSAFGAGSVLSLKKTARNFIELETSKTAHAIGNPDYALGNLDDGVKIEYVGMSCFKITSNSGIKIITDPFLAEDNITYVQLQREPADVITVSCGHFAHCNVSTVGGSPYLYQTTEPAEIYGIKFKGVATRHPMICDVMSKTEPGKNVVVCFEVDGIKFCHLGALGHRLSDEQIRQIGKVDVLMIPVGGVSSMPVNVATEVCDQLTPRVVFPMHYKSVRCPLQGWATVDEFLEGKKNVHRCDTNIGSSELTLKADMFTSETQIIVPNCVF